MWGQRALTRLAATRRATLSYKRRGEDSRLAPQTALPRLRGHATGLVTNLTASPRHAHVLSFHRSAACAGPGPRCALGAAFGFRPARVPRRAGRDHPARPRRGQLPGVDVDRRRQVAVLSIAGAAA